MAKVTQFSPSLVSLCRVQRSLVHFTQNIVSLYSYLRLITLSTLCVCVRAHYTVGLLLLLFLHTSNLKKSVFEIRFSLSVCVCSVRLL